MPVNYKRDYSPDFRRTSDRIRFERAGGKCERCGAPHLQRVLRSADGRYMLPDTGEVFDAETGASLGQMTLLDFPVKYQPKIVLTTAHLDHNTHNDVEDNLMALCQRCHFRHDAPNNARRRKYGKAFIANSKQLFS